MRRYAMILLAALTAGGSLLVTARDEPPPAVMTPEHEAGRKAVEAKDWQTALKHLLAAERKEPQNADVHNLLGFAYRHTGNLDQAFKHYDVALKIDPRHLGAHEYVGEAWLLAQNPAKAEQHLAELRRHCNRVCEERDDLEKAIAEYRKKNPK
jgi:Flp pilus assembly protein TadD